MEAGRPVRSLLQCFGEDDDDLFTKVVVCDTKKGVLQVLDVFER